MFWNIGIHYPGHPDSKDHGANMGPTWSRQDPGGPHVGPMNFAISSVQPTFCIRQSNDLSTAEVDTCTLSSMRSAEDMAMAPVDVRPL